MTIAIPHGKELRRGRWSEAGRPYLIITCCRSRQRLFGDLTLGRIVVDEILRSDKEDGSRTLAFVVMPDHLHWLMELIAHTSVESLVGRIKGRSASRINRVRRRSGPVWQAGFHDHALRTDESIVTVGEYVIHNPVRAGLVMSVDEYPLWDALWVRRGFL